MPTDIISSYHAFEERFGKHAFVSESDARIRALKRYFERGGVISVTPRGASWPILDYPSKKRVREQEASLQKLRQNYARQHAAWQRAHLLARTHNLRMNARKFTDPLYWKHVSKYAVDKTYRTDANAVRLPAELVGDKKYRAMVDQFVHNEDYRKQLTETVKTSVVYAQKNQRLARHAHDVQDFRKGVSKAQLDELAQKIRELDGDIGMLHTISKWARD